MVFICLYSTFIKVITFFQKVATFRYGLLDKFPLQYISVGVYHKSKHVTRGKGVIKMKTNKKLMLGVLSALMVGATTSAYAKL